MPRTYTLSQSEMKGGTTTGNSSAGSYPSNLTQGGELHASEAVYVQILFTAVGESLASY